MNPYIFVVLSILVGNLSFKCICQETDCYFAKEPPVIFNQDSLKAKIAKETLQKYKDALEPLDTISLIGISKMEILEDLSFMVDNPNSTNLNDSGYYCGIVVVLNWMLNNAPEKYVKAVIDLTFYGETIFENGSKKVQLPKILQEKVNYSLIFSENEKKRTDLGNISISDFVLGVSIVNSEKVIQKIGLLWKNSTHKKANIGNYLFANTMPWEMNDYFKIIGVTEIKSSYYSPFEQKKKILDNIFEAVNSGQMPIIMENHLLTADRHKNLFYKLVGAHFISVHDFQINYTCNTISMSYWDYGSVKNYREQSKKGSPLAARSLNAAIRRNSRLNKTKKDNKYLEIPIDIFFKGLKGYWIPN